MGIVVTSKIIIKKLLAYYQIKILGHKEVVLISDNCWGGEFYKEFKRPYNNPFVGLYLNPPCYIALLQDFDRIIKLPMSFIEQSLKYPTTSNKYPIGLLDGHVEVHFLHYSSEKEAKDKWERRLSRMPQQYLNKTSFYFKIGIEKKEHLSLLTDFYNLPFSHKISFAIWPYPADSHIVMEGKKLEDGLTLYYQSNKRFNIVKWLKN